MPCANSCRLWLTVPWLGSDISNQANRRLPDYTVSLNRRSSQLQQRPQKINNSVWTVRAEALQLVQAIGLLSNVAYSRRRVFLELRQFRIHRVPWLRVGGPNFVLRFVQTRIIQSPSRD